MTSDQGADIDMKAKGEAYERAFRICWERKTPPDAELWIRQHETPWHLHWEVRLPKYSRGRVVLPQDLLGVRPEDLGARHCGEMLRELAWLRTRWAQVAWDGKHWEHCDE